MHPPSPQPTTWQRRAAIATFTTLVAVVAGSGQLTGYATEAIAPPQAVDLQDHPLELDLVESDADLSERGIVTSSSISIEDDLTIPSLWWVQEQFGGKLLEHWLAYSGADGSPRRVDLVVDRQIWSLYSYLERYAFIHQFGTAAQTFGYSTRIFNDQGEGLATYTCTFAATGTAALPTDESAKPAELSRPEALEAIACRVTLDSPGISVFQGRNSPYRF